MATPPPSASSKKHWWLSNKKLVDRHIKDAKSLIASHGQSDMAAAINLLDSALAVSPRLEAAIELKARCLLHLRRFKDVADMLQDYIPSCKIQSSSDYSSDNSSNLLPRERANLLPSTAENSCPSLDYDSDHSFKCFSVSDLKKKVLAGLSKNSDKEGQWRYLVLGQACCHLGMMEDAMVLLQTGKRLATAAFRRQSVCWSDDSFSLSETPLVTATELAGNTSSSSESESVAHLLAHIKWLLRRRAAAFAAMEAGADAEAIRHFTKILESRRGTPQAFLAECYIHRASAYKSAGRVAEAIADCNRTMALDPASIPALTLRSQLLESIRAYPDCLRDLEHLKLLHDAILRDRKLPGPAWKRHSVRYSDLAGNLKNLTAKIQAMRQRLASMSWSETGSAVDYHALMGLLRGCTRSELERAHLLLTLRHRPDISSSFVDRCEFMDDWDVEVVKDQARMSSLFLYRLLQKGYSYVMSGIMEAEAAEKERKKAAAAVGVPAQASATTERPAQAPVTTERPAQAPATTEPAPMRVSAKPVSPPSPETTMPASVFQGVFCRDMAVVGSLLSQVGFNRPIPVKYEALRC